MADYPHWGTFKRKERKRRLLRRLFSLRTLVIAVVLFAAYFIVTAPRHRGRVDRNSARVEKVTLPDHCETTLVVDNQRVRIQLLSVGPETDRGGLTAQLNVKLCNLSEADLTIPGLDFRYTPATRASPGFGWHLEQTTLGSGFCDEYPLRSEPLGELVVFRNEGSIVVRGPAGAAVITLPRCLPPTPTVTATPRATAVPTETAVPEPTQTPLPDPDPRQFEVSTRQGNLEIGQYVKDHEPFYDELFTAPSNGFVELVFEIANLTSEKATTAVVGSLPEDIPPKSRDDLRKVLGRPVYMSMLDERQVVEKDAHMDTVYLFPVLYRKGLPGRRSFYYVDTVESRPVQRDRELRSASFRMPVAKGETLVLLTYVRTTKKNLREPYIIARRYHLFFYHPLLPTPTPTPVPPTRTPRPTRTPTPTPRPPCRNDAIGHDEPAYAPSVHGTHDLLLCRRRYSGKSYEDVDWFQAKPLPQQLAPHGHWRTMTFTLQFNRREGEVAAKLYELPGELGTKLVLVASSQATADGAVIEYKARKGSQSRYCLAVMLVSSSLEREAPVAYSLTVKGVK